MKLIMFFVLILLRLFDVVKAAQRMGMSDGVSYSYKSYVQDHILG